MSSYKEFKSDVKNWGISYLLATFIIYVFKIFVVVMTFGMSYVFDKFKKNKEINDNYYKI